MSSSAIEQALLRTLGPENLAHARQAAAVLVEGGLDPEPVTAAIARLLASRHGRLVVLRGWTAAGGRLTAGASPDFVPCGGDVFRRFVAHMERSP